MNSVTLTDHPVDSGDPQVNMKKIASTQYGADKKWDMERIATMKYGCDKTVGMKEKDCQHQA